MDIDVDKVQAEFFGQSYYPQEQYGEIWRTPPYSGWTSIGEGVAVWEADGTIVRPNMSPGTKYPTLLWQGSDVGFDSGWVVKGKTLYLRQSGGDVGLYQVNAVVPSGAPKGSGVPAIVSIGGVQSNIVTIAVQ
jgi:hypothetical protein